VQSFSYNEVTESVDASGMGEPKSYLSGQADGSGNVVCNHDHADTGQAEIVNGDTVTLSLQGEGAGAGKHTLDGSVLIDNVSYSTNKNGVPQFSFTFKGVLAKTDQT
jgi:hypothetical protein